MVRKILSQKSRGDTYLKSIAARFSSHQHLGNATGSIYVRQANLVSEIASEQLKGKGHNNIKVLDWGCGKGQISYLLSNMGLDVTSCDILCSAEDSTFGQETPIIDEYEIKVDMLQHDWELPYDDQSFDIIVSFGVLEHVKNDRESLSEIHRVLKSGGHFVVFFLPNLFSWSQWLARIRGDWYHDRLYSITSISEMLSENNIQVEHIWRGQLFPKNRFGDYNILEKLDRFLTNFTPLSLISTNIELIGTKK